MYGAECLPRLEDVVRPRGLLVRTYAELRYVAAERLGLYPFPKALCEVVLPGYVHCLAAPYHDLHGPAEPACGSPFEYEHAIGSAFDGREEGLACRQGRERASLRQDAGVGQGRPVLDGGGYGGAVVRGYEDALAAGDHLDGTLW